MAQFRDPQAYVCTPSSLLASNPCLACLSEKELLAALLGVLTLSDELHIPDVLKNSACFTCLSKKQMLQALVTIMGNNLLGEAGDVPAVIEEIKCLECASEKQILAALLYLICNEGAFTIEPLPT